MFEGEEGFKLILYIEGLFDTEELAKEDCCLNLKPEGDFLVVCVIHSLNIAVFPRTTSSLSTEQNEDSFLGLLFCGLCHI